LVEAAAVEPVPAQFVTVDSAQFPTIRCATLVSTQVDRLEIAMVMARSLSRFSPANKQCYAFGL